MRTYVTEKVNARWSRSDQLPAETLAELEYRNRLNRELYRFGETLFRQQLSKINLETEIEVFRSRCADRSMCIRDAARRVAFARWKKLRRRWSPYPFLG